MRSDAGRPHVAIVGGGFSGAALVFHLTKAAINVTLLERGDRVTAGLAYSTQEPRHLLNVRAAKMSALPAEPDHFVDWLKAREEGGATRFAPRRLYAEYLADVLQPGSGGARVVRAVAVGWNADGVLLADGPTLHADAVVIAAGNILPEPIETFNEAGVRYVHEPWSADAQRTLAEAARRVEDVLLIGTGLTAIDAVLSLDANGFGGRVIALSRRGLLPQAHAETAAGSVAPVPKGSPLDMLRALGRQAETCDWRDAVDALRPVTADVWRGWTVAQRGRFLRHLRPWWDVHRHRIAPEVARRLAELIADGRLVVAAGRIAGHEDGRVRVRFRGADKDEAIEAATVVNCTGPQGDLRRSRDPLLVDLLRSGAARTDAFGLGLDVDAACRVLGANGLATPGLYAIGPMTKGTFWETVAVPDIRRQAAELAATLAADLTVEARLAS
ncbi:MAG TPA: FAD/NAD(P)-binding protein [Sphingomonadaceae bacterium]|nr:FAD/NAD(P)-binding protein [Sphingomonadaceae bacterium]